MQCPNCARTLPDTVSFCFSCGFPITREDEAGASVAGAAAPGEARPDASSGQALADNVGREISMPAEADFVFQEFGGSASGLPPVNQWQPGPGAGAPVFAPPAPIPGYPGVVPYPFPPAGQGVYPLQGAPAEPTRKRRGRSVGCIVLYAFLAIVLLFTSLGIVGYEVGSHVLGGVNAQYQATKTAAMQLYQQVTSKPPTLQDSLAASDSSFNNWSLYDEPMFGCTLDTNGLRVHIAQKGRFFYCTNTVDTFKNVAFQVQMQFSSGDVGGLVFRVSSSADNSTDSLYVFQITPGGNYTLELDKSTKNAQFTELATGITQAMDAHQDATNTLTVIAQGQVFDLYVNQQFVAQGHDATLSTGTVGVLATDNTNPTVLLYTNAKIWDLD